MFRKRKSEARSPVLMEGQDDTSFRRSRTLQGTTSSTIKTVNPKRASLKSERLKQQQKRRRKQFAMFLFFLVAALALFVWFLVSQYIVSVGDLKFTPQTVRQPQKSIYEEKITNYLNEHPTERFRFLLNEDRLSQHISQLMPEVENIKPTGFLSNKPSFSVLLRKPIASWKSENAQSYVDENGVSFARNYFTQPGVIIVDNSGISPEKTGAPVVSERLLRFLGRLISISQSSGLGKVMQATLPKDTTREVDIGVEGKPYLIKTHIDRDPAATVEDIKRVVQYLEQKKLSAQYIDVRVNGRAFYR